MKQYFRVIEINGSKAVIKCRPKNLIVPLSRLKFVTVERLNGFAEITPPKKVV